MSELLIDNTSTELKVTLHWINEYPPLMSRGFDYLWGGRGTWSGGCVTWRRRFDRQSQWLPPVVLLTSPVPVDIVCHSRTSGEDCGGIEYSRSGTGRVQNQTRMRHPHTQIGLHHEGDSERNLQPICVSGCGLQEHFQFSTTRKTLEVPRDFGYRILTCWRQFTEWWRLVYLKTRGRGVFDTGVEREKHVNKLGKIVSGMKRESNTTCRLHTIKGCVTSHSLWTNTLIGFLNSRIP